MGSQTTEQPIADTTLDPSKPFTMKTEGIGGSQTDRCVDQEREAAIGQQFGTDPTFESEVRKLAERVATESVYVGDCNNRTKLIKRIGGGSFGEIYLGIKEEEGESINGEGVKVAVKIEPQSVVMQYLINEGNVYRKLEGVAGIPRVHWYGHHGIDFAMLVMDLLGETLYELWVKCGSKFSMKTMLMLIDQMLGVVEHMHKNSYVHRDISVSNFMTGQEDSGSKQIHLIDFGHAKKFAGGKVLVPAVSRKRVVLPKLMVGTPRFASVFCHMGQEEGFRDDMESLGFVWIYLAKGKLPWQGQRLLPGENKLDKIAYIKLNTRLESLCEGLPEEFLVYMNYVRRLRSFDVPDYEQIRELFRNLAQALKIKYDWKFDWVKDEADV